MPVDIFYVDRGSELNSMHIPKHHLYTCGKAIEFGTVHKCIYQNPNLLNIKLEALLRFGAVQKRIYQNARRRQNVLHSGSELYK